MQPIRYLISARKTTSSISNVIQNNIQGKQIEMDVCILQAGQASEC